MKKARTEVMHLLRRIGVLFRNRNLEFLSPNFIKILNFGTNQEELRQMIKCFGQAVARKVSVVDRPEIVISQNFYLALSVSECIKGSKPITLAPKDGFNKEVCSKKVILVDCFLENSTNKLIEVCHSLGMEVVLVCVLFRKLSGRLFVKNKRCFPEVFSLIDFNSKLRLW